MTNSEIRAYARSCLKGNVGRLFAPFFIVILIEAVLTLPAIFQAAALAEEASVFTFSDIDFIEMAPISPGNEFLSLVSNIVSLFTPVLYVGLADICITAVRRSFYSLSDLFAGTSQFIGIILTNLLAGLFIFLKLLLFIVPGIIESYALAMTNFVRADDPSLGAHEAIERSRWLMDGNKLDFFKLQLSFIPWFLLSIVTLGIGFVYVIPYYNVSVAAFYESLFLQEKKSTEKPFCLDGNEESQN